MRPSILRTVCCSNFQFVPLVPLGASHVTSRGWTMLRHTEAKRTADKYFANATVSFVVHGVPTALLIDREGKIDGAENPSSIDLPAELAKLGIR